VARRKLPSRSQIQPGVETGIDPGGSGDSRRAQGFGGVIGSCLQWAAGWRETVFAERVTGHHPAQTNRFRPPMRFQSETIRRRFPGGEPSWAGLEWFSVRSSRDLSPCETCA
jgi:hypothetical protein